MPGIDGTGPMGEGAMTGRGAGVCETGVGRRSANFAGGRGCGMGLGRGAGMRAGRGMGLGRGAGSGAGGGMGLGRQFNARSAQFTPEEEKNSLEQSVKILEEELKATKQRIEEIG